VPFCTRSVRFVRTVISPDSAAGASALEDSELGDEVDPPLEELPQAARARVATIPSPTRAVFRVRMCFSVLDAEASLRGST
jgi:hypothetical protein